MASSFKQLDMEFKNTDVKVVRIYGEPVGIHVKQRATEDNDYKQDTAVLRLSTDEVEEFIAGLQFLLKG